MIYDLPYFFDEPLGDSSVVPTFLVSKVAKENVTVVLGGDAADEIFGGYERYWVYKFFSLQKYLPYLVRKFNLSILGQISNLFNSDFLKKFHRMLVRGKDINSHIIYGNIFASISSKDFYKMTGEKIDYSSFKPYFNQKFSKNVQSCDLNHYLLEDIFAKVDRASMAHALETRTPFYLQK